MPMPLKTAAPEPCRRRRSMRRRLAVLCAGLLLACAAHAFRYDQPPLGRLILDTVLAPEAAQELALRLPRTGRYYAELILEPPADGSLFTPDTPRELTLDVRFLRRDREVHRASAVAAFAPGERARTLFWLDAPGTLPDRAALRMLVTVTPTGSSALDGADLRLQVTRKPDFLPLVPR